MYSMKDACTATGLNYETLKFYCNEGLVPNVERDKNNYRVFSDNNIEWIKNLNCLKNCGMSIAEMKQYLALCLKGSSTIPERQQMLAAKHDELIAKQQQIQSSIDFVDYKQSLYADILAGKQEYVSLFTTN